MHDRGFHVVQVCNPPDLLFVVAAWFKLMYGARMVFDHHDISPELYEAKYGRRDVFYQVLRLAERLTFATADVVISTNESYRTIALTRGHKRPDDVFVVRNGPDLSRFVETPPDAAYKRGRRYLVGYVGTMGEQEGIDYLLRAARIIVHELGRSDFSFTIIGGGPAVEGLRRLQPRARRRGLRRVPRARLRRGAAAAALHLRPVREPRPQDAVQRRLDDDQDHGLHGAGEGVGAVRPRRRAAIRRRDASVYAPGRTTRATSRARSSRWPRTMREGRRWGVSGAGGWRSPLEWRRQIPSLIAAHERAQTMARDRPSAAPRTRMSRRASRPAAGTRCCQFWLRLVRSRRRFADPPLGLGRPDRGDRSSAVNVVNRWQLVDGCPPFGRPRCRVPLGT